MGTTTAPRFVRADGPDKVTGSGRYAADLSLTGVLTAKFKYAEIAHARTILARGTDLVQTVARNTFKVLVRN